MPALDVELPGVIVSRLVPSEVISELDLGLRPLAQSDGEDHRGDADEDARARSGPSAAGGSGRR